MVKPISKNIIVEPIVKETTEGGIILGDAQEKKPIGKVISVGDEVTAGDVIAAVGSTGNSTGNHLHLEIRLNGNKINPQLYLYK